MINYGVEESKLARWRGGSTTRDREATSTFLFFVVRSLSRSLARSGLIHFPPSCVELLINTGESSRIESVRALSTPLKKNNEIRS